MKLEEVLEIVNYGKGNLLQINIQNDEFRIIQLPLLDDEVDDIKAVINKINNNLIELKKIDNAKPSEALNYLYSFITENETAINKLDYTGYSVEKQKQYKEYLFQKREMLNSIRDALLKAQELEKVLEIIKGKTVDILELKFAYSVNEYNIAKQFGEELTKEEFELLKRWIEE